MTGHAVVDSTVLGSSGATYSVTYPDQQLVPANTTNITTATTTLAVAGVSGQYIYVYFAAGLTTGTNSASYGYYAYGPNSSTLTSLFGGIFVGLTASSGFDVNYGAGSGNQYSVMPNTIPYIIPVGMNLYYITSGSTISVKPYVLYAIHG